MCTHRYCVFYNLETKTVDYYGDTKINSDL